MLNKKKIEKEKRVILEEQLSFQPKQRNPNPFDRIWYL